MKPGPGAFGPKARRPRLCAAIPIAWFACLACSPAWQAVPVPVASHPKPDGADSTGAVTSPHKAEPAWEIPTGDSLAPPPAFGAAPAPVDSQGASPPLPGSDASPDSIPNLKRPPGLHPYVRVALVRGRERVRLYSLGRVIVYANQGNGPFAEAAALRGSFAMEALPSGGLRLAKGDRRKDIPEGGHFLCVSENPYNLLEDEDGAYRGRLAVAGDGRGRLMLVDVVDMEDYLRGVLPVEMGNVDATALEALKAQAVVARTYAYKRAARPPHPEFDLYPDVQDQVYRGVRPEYLLGDRAVAETRGLVVLHADTLATCYYHSTCGGRTASLHEVWGGEPVPYLVSRPDTDAAGRAYCLASRYSAWRESWTLPELARGLRRNLREAAVPNPPAFASVLGLEVAARASCGRVRILSIDTDRGQILVRGDKVRWALKPRQGQRILPSAWFDLRNNGGTVTAEGRALGHGVGLCQYGAMGRARQGQGYREIIDAYYTGVRLARWR